MKNDLRLSPVGGSALNRRQLLKGAAATVGASMLAFGPAAAVAQVLGSVGSGPVHGVGALPIVSVGYWDGLELVSAAGLSSGDSTLESVSVNIDGRAAGTAFGSLTVDYVTTEAGTIPFTAWVAAPSGVSCVGLTVPVAAQQGMTLAAQVGSSATVAATPINFVLGSGSGPKLREGIYVLAVGAVVWGSIPFNPATFTGSQPGGPQLIVLTVSRS